MKRRFFLKHAGLGHFFLFIKSNVLISLWSCQKASLEREEPRSPKHEGNDDVNNSHSENSVSTNSFVQRLPIPEFALSTAILHAQETTASIIDDTTQKVLGYQENNIMGPTFLVDMQSQMNITLKNKLTEPTNIHWHGLIIPQNMDGHPEDVIHTGGHFTYTFTINQRAGTYWYHPHPHHFTPKQVHLGLGGFFIIKDAEEEKLKLPKGAHELFFNIQDKRIFNNTLTYQPTQHDIMFGYVGQHLCVNGKYKPYQDVSADFYRIRILNGSNALIYNLKLSNGLPLNIIGSDCGLIDKPKAATAVTLSPGERVDLIVDFSSVAVGSAFYLVNNLENMVGVGNPLIGNEISEIIKFNVVEKQSKNWAVSAVLSQIDRLQSTDAVKTRRFEISTHHHGRLSSLSINGKQYDPETVNEKVKANSIEIWEFDNRNGMMAHPMHMHGVHFQVLERQGGRNHLLPAETGWKDTVLVMSGEIVRVIIPFGRNLGKYVFHCHNLEHENEGMMLQYEIVA